MSDEMNYPISRDYFALIEDLKSRVDVIETAFGMVNSATDQILQVEMIVKEVKSKINQLETRLTDLLDTLTKHLKYNEDRICTMEKKIKAMENKESLFRQLYTGHNLKN